MQESNLNLTQSKNIQRILFIDLARSIAIILMLEGHFITLTFEDYTSMVAELRSVGTSGSLIFDTWVKIRGFLYSYLPKILRKSKILLFGKINE